MMFVCGAIFSVLFAITSVDLYKHLTIRKELNILGREQMEKNQKLQAIAGQIPEEQTRNQILSEIKNEENEKKEKEEMLSLLINAQSNKIGGFSGYFESLAKGFVDGLWLTDINLRENGDSFSLTGKALRPELVPELIAKLGNEEIFKGKSFQVFKMLLDEKTKQIDFILETRPIQTP
jgi:hypothetical protein